MAHKETEVVKAAMVRVSKTGTRIFRNNVGTGFQGKPHFGRDGSLTLQMYRVVKYGLVEGSSDLIGWTERVITPDMVGKKVAIFTALEGKTAEGAATPEQKNFIVRVNEAGGLAGVFRSADEAEAIVTRML